MPKPIAKPRKKKKSSIFDPIKRRGPGSGNVNTDKLLRQLEDIEKGKRPKKPKKP